MVLQRSEGKADVNMEVYYMPRGDRTGPGGKGPMTGRSGGYCTGIDMPGYLSPGPGLGLGGGREAGRAGRFTVGFEGALDLNSRKISGLKTRLSKLQK